MEEIDKLKEQIKKLENRLEQVENRRLVKSDFLPGVVTNRAMGEANDYVKILASSPTGATFNENTRAYFNSTDSKWYVYNGTAWVSIPLTTTISTGWSVTNNTPDKSIDANGLVAEIGDGLTTLINTLITQGILSA